MEIIKMEITKMEIIKMEIINMEIIKIRSVLPSEKNAKYKPFKRRVRSHLPSAIIIRSSPYFPR